MNDTETTKFKNKHDALARRFDGVSISYCDPALKDAFHSGFRAYMKLLASALGIPRTAYDVRSNKAGIAVSGEITLHSDALYVQASQSCMGDNVTLLIRGCRSRRDYTGMTNYFVAVMEGNMGKVLEVCREATRKD